MDELSRTRIATPAAVLVAAVAVRAEDQVQGLQDRRPLGLGEALAFPQLDSSRRLIERPATFHMGRVAYPIDVAFIDGCGRVSRLVEHAQPGARERWTAPAAWVVETRGGVARRAGLVLGAQVDVPEAAATGGAAGELHDPGTFAAALLEGLALSRRAPEWRPSRKDGGRTETAVIDKDTLLAWISALPLDEADHQRVLEATMSPAGWSALTDGLILAGLADVAHVVGDHLLLTRGRRLQRDAARGAPAPDLSVPERAGRMLRREALVRALAAPGMLSWHTPGAPAVVRAPLHPGVAAVMLVQQTLAGCSIPGVQIRYAGMHRTSGAGGHGITNGVIDVHVAFRTARGVDHVVQVPIYVREGNLHRPTVMLDQGVVRLLAQPSFDEAVGRFEYPQDKPARAMFSPPGSGGHAPFWS